MDIVEKLKNFGLTTNEAKIYLFLLEHGLATPPEIAGVTGIARTNSYNILVKLQYLGLVKIIKKKNKKAYIALSPSGLSKTLDKKRDILNSVLPDLKALAKKNTNKPVIKFFEGFNEVKLLYAEALETNELHAIGSTQKLIDIDEEFFINYERQVKDRGIIVHEIIPSKSKERGLPQSKIILKGLLESFSLPNKYPDLSSDILIWDNNIAIINLDEPIFGTKLTHAGLANTFRIIFSVMSDVLIE